MPTFSVKSPALEDMTDSQKRRLRWRLVLGETTENTLGGLPDEWSDRETAIGFLYDRELQGQNIRSRGNSGSSDRTKYLDKINCIIFSKFSKNFFYRQHKSLPARIGIYFNPFIFNKSPQNFN
jgi:hypothetical protein